MNANTLWGRVGQTLAQTLSQTLAQTLARLLLLLTLACLTLWSGAASATVTTTTLSVSATSVATNQAVTLTATVSPNTAVGYVSFLDGGSNLGSVTLSNGVAVLSKAFYTTGAHNLTAVFNATTGSYTGSTSATVVETVGTPATSTSTTLAINPTTVTTGQFFTLTATVSPSAAPGYIAFMDGSNTLGTVTLNNGVAVLSKSLSVTGAHNITAVYNASSSAYSNSTSATVVETVNNPVTTTTTSLSTSPTSVAVGQSFTLTGTVSPSSATGYIAFMEGSNTLGAVTVSNGVATLSKALYDVGNHSITAVFNASSSAYTNSTSATVVETVGSAGPATATTTTLTTSSSTVALGQLVTLTASVNPSAGTGNATGSVTFKDGSSTLGTGTLSGGVATLAVTFTTTGAHSLSAVYGGDSSNLTSTSTAVTETVTTIPTSITLSASPSTVNTGQTVTLSVTLSPSSASGTVSFMDGATTLGTASLSAGSAVLSTSFGTTGTHSLTAVYAGSATHAGSTSAAVNETVNALTATSTTLSTSSSTVTIGQSVTLTASVTPGTGTGTVTGTITFKDGSTTLGTGTLSGGTATLSTSFTTTGTHSLTAIYGGDSNNQTSTSAAVAETVNNLVRPTSTSLSAAVPAISVGQNLTLTASVTATGTATTSPTGTVTFMDGSTTLGTGTLSTGGSSSIATLSVGFTTTGTHVLTAIYAGDSSNLTSTSAAVNETVLGPQVALPAPPSSSTPVLGFGYDRMNQPTQVTQAPGISGFNLTTSTAYDALGRPKTVTDPQSGTTQLSYDGLGRVTTVIDPRSLSTQYPRDGLGQATQLQSPDTGTANLGYDVAGNLSTRTDSRGVLAGYSYDAINRLTGVTFSLAGQSQSYTWTYDQTGGSFTNGIGRLTTASFPEGSTSYAYDQQGRIVQVAQTVNAASGTNSQNIRHTTAYGYDAAGHITSLVYPSGRTLNISYTGGLPTTLALAQNAIATAVPLLSNIQYAPFGAAQAWNWNMTGSAAGPQPYARSFDTSGRLTRYPLATSLGNTLRDLSYDPASRITAYTHYQAAVGASSGIALPSLDQQFSYDANGRLTQATVANPTAVTTWAYSYDANGNRTSVAINGNTPGAYTIDAASNRVTAISTPPVSLSYDAAGNTLSDGTYSLGYNLRGRLSSVAVNGNQTTYSHDNAGNRVRKFSNSGANSTQLFVYDQSGHLLGEYDQTGAPIREYIWLDDQPVAVFTPDPAAGSNAQNAPPLVFYIYADHLNTPRAVVDTAGNLRWSWVDEPFGTTAANSNPQGQGTFIFSLRFPGQFYDAESGMHYNVNRDYVPGVGRYAQSDPVGLAGGQDSTYAYVGNNPLLFIDPLGLWAVGDPLPQDVIDFGAGMGDTMLFGQGQRVRDMFNVDGGVNQCSDAYDNGEWAGIAASFVTGFSGGLRAAGAKGAGKEFSHWIPNRMGGPRSVFNGNFVPTATHALSDPFRYRFMPSAWKMANPMPSAVSQQWIRIPNVYKGAAAGGTYGAAGAAQSGCTCHR